MRDHGYFVRHCHCCSVELWLQAGDGETCFQGAALVEEVLVVKVECGVDCIVEVRREGVCYWVTEEKGNFVEV